MLSESLHTSSFHNMNIRLMKAWIWFRNEGNIANFKSAHLSEVATLGNSAFLELLIIEVKEINT